jgi:Icc-related predicted phosphoesterase
MKILPISDLHFEFHADHGESFVKSLPEADVVILAGDIAVGKGIVPALRMFHQKYKEVIYVLGNHEFYGHTRGDIHELTKAAGHMYPSLRWLDGQPYVLPGGTAYVKNEDGGALNERILGCPLWFRMPPLTDQQYEGAKRGMSDFSQIKYFEEWVYEDNRAQVQYLEDSLQEGDIVVTHYLPSFKSVAKEFSGSLLNCFFVCDIEKLILERKPKLWIHGHTHTSCDYMLGATRVVCNPFGYVRLEENSKFNPELIIDTNQL